LTREKGNCVVLAGDPHINENAERDEQKLSVKQGDRFQRDARTRVARSYWRAQQRAESTSGLLALIPYASYDDARSICREIDLMRMSVLGAVPLGRKLSLPPVIENEVDMSWVYIFSDGQLTDGARVTASRFVAPRLGAELALTVDRDLNDPNLPDHQIVAAVESVTPVLEIIDSRSGRWDLHHREIIADSGLHAALVCGDVIPFCPAQITEITARVAVGSRRVGTPLARVRDFAKGPVAQLCRLARLLIEQGEPIRAGEIILTGSLTPSLPLERGKTYAAEFAGLGDTLAVVSVTAR
jgi:2-keto-4-pentenoate hydratase